jgi:hypothetical protein
MVTALSCHLAPFLVARPVERRQDFLGEPRGFFEHGVDQIGRRLFATRQLRHLFQPGEFLEHELHVTDRGNVFTHVSSPPMGTAVVTVRRLRQPP